MGPGAPAVLMLTTFRADDAVRRALRAGASGYVLKDAAPAELATAIEGGGGGPGVADPTLARDLLPELAREPVRRSSPIDAALPSSPTVSVRY